MYVQSLLWEKKFSKFTLHTVLAKTKKTFTCNSYSLTPQRTFFSKNHTHTAPEKVLFQAPFFYLSYSSSKHQKARFLNEAIPPGQPQTAHHNRCNHANDSKKPSKSGCILAWHRDIHAKQTAH